MTDRLWFAHLLEHNSPTTARAQPHRCRPALSTRPPSLEVLEDRTAPALLLVTSPVDTHQDWFLTLREAVSAANTDAGSGQSDTIAFAPDLGQATITLTEGPLELSGATGNATESIDGGGLITVSGNDTSRVLTVREGVTAVLTGLTLTRGNATNGSGGGIYNAGALTINSTTLMGRATACQSVYLAQLRLNESRGTG